MTGQDAAKASHPIAEQAGHFAPQFRASYSAVRPVCQSTIEFRHSGVADRFVAIRRIVLNWVSSRAGRPLPAHAWQGESFELEDIGSQRTAAVSIKIPRYWAARLDDSDREVPQRNWVNEVGIAGLAGGGAILGTRLLCVTRGEDRPFQPSIQRFLRTAVESIPDAYVEGRRIEVTPWIVGTETDVEDLVALISSKTRRLDVIVSALPEGSENPADSTIDAFEIHRRTYGAAHVAIITSSASFVLSDHLGKEFSTFRGAVRTYKPGFDTNLDEPFRHPLALPARILGWPDGGAEAYERFIIGQTLGRSANGRDAERHSPPFSEVRRIASQLKLDSARQSVSSDGELLALADKEITELRDAQSKDKEIYQGLVEQYERERDLALDKVLQIEAANANLRQRLRLMDDQAKARFSEAAKTPIPTSLDGFEAWCRAHLSGAVEVHNRAFQGVKKSRFDDIGLLYRALVLLRDYYVPMRREGGIERLESFEKACEGLGLSEEPTFSGDRWGEQGEEYRVRYSGGNCLLDRHLKKGNSKDERYCFRLYFFWDKDSEQAVVGWLPSHLDTRVT